MVSISWTREQGWHDAKVMPYGPIAMDPAASVLHYGQEIFEGIKAYRHQNGNVVTFRPEANAQRMNESARSVSPCPNCQKSCSCARSKKLVRVDVDWVPSREDQSLYLRPFMISDESFLGVRAAEKARFMVIASPAGPTSPVV